MAANPIFPLYYNDIDRSTRDWTDEEFGCYMRLLMHQWSQGEIPKETQRLSRIVTSIQATWHTVGKKFVETETGMINKRLEEIRSERMSFLKKQQENGKKGGRKPKLNPDINPKKSLHNEYEVENEDVNETFIVPQLCQIWYTVFPLYTKDQKRDFPAVQQILQFMIKQHDILNVDENADLIKDTFRQVAEEVSKDNFWKNKPLKSIANGVQEFYNKIKNPINESHKRKPTRSEQLQAGYEATLSYYARRNGNGQSVSGQTD